MPVPYFLLFSARTSLISFFLSLKAARREEQHRERIAALAQEAEADKANKAALRRGNAPAHSPQTGSVPDIPRIVIDTVDDRPIKPTKKKKSGGSKTRSSSSPPSSVPPPESLAKKSHSKKAKTPVKEGTTKKKEKESPVKDTMSTEKKRNTPKEEIKKLRYTPEDNDEIIIQESNGKRRRLPSKRYSSSLLSSP